MPFRSHSVVDARRAFVLDLFTSAEPLAVVARRHGISRPVAYKWRDRFLELGKPGLLDRSRAPRRHPNETPEAVVDLIVELRVKHPRWGAAKLRALLQERYPGLHVPSTSVVHRIIKKAGLVIPKKRRSRDGCTPPPSHLGPQDLPNQSWSMDYKGDFPLRGGGRCYPFTLMDAASRYLLACRACPSTSSVHVRRALASAFSKHGLPEAIRSDNGSPFASSSFTGLTELSVWLIELGIRLDRTQPGHPQQNGRLERYHRTIKAAACSPPSSSMAGQQRRFDTHRREYNEVRPHASLGQSPPARSYKPSPRRLPKRTRRPDYSGLEVRRVTAGGQVTFRGWRLPLGAVLAGKDVCFVPQEGDTWEVRFHERPLGWLVEPSGTLDNGSIVRRCKHLKEWR